MPGAYNPERRTKSIDPGPMGPGIRGGPDKAHPAPPTETILGRSRSAHCFVKGETMVIPPKLKPPTQRRGDGAGPSPHFIEEEMRGEPSSPQSMHEEEHIIQPLQWKQESCCSTQWLWSCKAHQ